LHAVRKIFQGGHVGVERLPVIAYQGHPAGGGKLAGDALPLVNRPRREFVSEKFHFPRENSGSLLRL
jgi:hypothetical protein